MGGVEHPGHTREAHAESLESGDGGGGGAAGDLKQLGERFE